MIQNKNEDFLDISTKAFRQQLLKLKKERLKRERREKR